MAEDEHAMSVAIVLKSPRVGGKFEVGVGKGTGLISPALACYASGQQ